MGLFRILLEQGDHADGAGGQRSGVDLEANGAGGRKTYFGSPRLGPRREHRPRLRPRRHRRPRRPARLRFRIRRGDGGATAPRPASCRRSPRTFLLDWQILGSDPATSADPDVGFYDIQLFFGEFVNDFLAPIFEPVIDIIAPFKPILDFLTDPLPIVSDLTGQAINAARHRRRVRRLPGRGRVDRGSRPHRRFRRAVRHDRGRIRARPRRFRLLRGGPA